MSRLTEKNKFDIHYSINISKNLLQSAYDKLGKLEDLEEELGCPLDVLGKVILQKHFYDIYGNKIDTNIDYINQDIIINAEELQWGEWAANDKPIYLKEHKKSWWLKEDKSE